MRDCLADVFDFALDDAHDLFDRLDVDLLGSDILNPGREVGP